MITLHNKKRGADGVKIAILRIGRAALPLIWAAAHAPRYISGNY